MARTTKTMMDKALSEALEKKNRECEDLAESLRVANLKLAKHQEDNAVHRMVSQERDAAVTREQETRAQFADLKSRLFDATKTIERLNGYIARVQEDDHVREELLTVGDPNGEQLLVPKRKHAITGGVLDDHEQSLDMGKAGPYDRQERTKPRRWVSY